MNTDKDIKTHIYDKGKTYIYDRALGTLGRSR